MYPIKKAIYFQLDDRAQPFNKNMHKATACIWKEDYKKILSQIKEYLAKPPIRMPLIQWKPLILYILAMTNSLGSLLA